MKNIVVTRIKTPQIIKRTNVVSIPKVSIVNPQKIKQSITQTVAKIPPKAPPLAPPTPINKAVVHSRLQKQKTRVNKEIKYISDDVTPDSIVKIKSILNVGVGRILVMIGNGPSINDIPLEQLNGNANIHIMSINKPHPKVWPTTYWAFCDTSQYIRNEEIWHEYKGLIINSTAIKKQKSNTVQIKNLGGKGFSRDLTRGYHIGRSTVFANMQTALWMGYEHIYILGVDMRPDADGPTQFYGNNPDVDPEVRRSRFEKEAEWYDHAAEILPPEIRSRFTFCSDVNPWEFTSKFNKAGHMNIIDRIIGHASGLSQ